MRILSKVMQVLLAITFIFSAYTKAIGPGFFDDLGSEDMSMLKAFNEIIANSIDSWIQETHALTKKIYMELSENKNLGYEYSYDNFEIIRCQLLKAGLRLAFILDDIFK